MLRVMYLLSIGAALSASSLVSAADTISLTSALTTKNGGRAGGGQILAYTPHQHTVLSTLNGAEGHGAQILTLGPAGELAERGVALFRMPFGESKELSSVSAVAADPAGRGFGAVALIPADSGGVRGRVGFFDYQANVPDEKRILATLEVGYHPDHLLFSSNGNFLFVANEGEYKAGGAQDAPGSVSIIDLSTVRDLAELLTLKNDRISDVNFSPEKLIDAEGLTRIRINDTSAEAQAHRARHIEPEFMCLHGNSLYVSLQENNAIGVLAINCKKPTESKWEVIHSLSAIVNTIDASDQDGMDGQSAAIIDDRVKGLPMPDGIGAFEVEGRSYIVTANEGDFRPDDGDRVRVGDFAGVEGHFKVDRSAQGLGRLRVLANDCDPDGDEALDDVVTAGTRSMSIWDGSTGALVADTGSLEPLLLRLDPKLHNIEDGSEGAFDERSDDKGPEPEGLAVAHMDGRIYVIVAMERQNGIVLFDVSDPYQPRFAGYTNSWQSNLIAPESVTFVPAEENPTRSNLALVGYEGEGGGIGVYSVAPASDGETGKRDNEGPANFIRAPQRTAIAVP